MNQRTVAELAKFLESTWFDEFSESLSEQHDAPVGFALARAVLKGWAVASDTVEPNLQAAEDLMCGG